MKRQTLGVLILAAGFLAAGRGSLAADTSAEASADNKAVPGLEGNVGNAQRREESLSKTAVAVTAFSSAQLIERSITTETDLQAAVPGLTVKTGENANSIFYAIRGQTLDVASG